MKKGSSKYDEMPQPNRRLYDLVCEKSDGNVSVFAEILGVKQQTLNRLFNPDPRSHKYPSISSEIKTALYEKMGLSESWLYSSDEPKNDELLSYNIPELLDEIRRLKSVKLPTDADKVMDIWLRFMENQRQQNEIMREMAELYKQIKGE